MSRPRVRRTVAGTPRSCSADWKLSMALAAGAAQARVGRVVRDQVDLERLVWREHVGQLYRLLVAVVHAVQHQVLDVDAPPALLAPAPAGVQHVGQRVAVVDRHQLAAQRLVGRVQRQRQADRRPVALGQALDAGDPADRRDGRDDGGDADVRQPLAGAEHVVQVHQRLAHAHEHQVVDVSLRLKCSAWSRISDVVRLRPNFIVPVAQNVHVSGQPDWDETHSDRRPSR